MSYVARRFLMFTAQIFIKQKNSLYSWRSVFSIFFASGLSHYNDAFFTYSAKYQKSKKCRSYETWAIEILPPQGGKIGPACHAPPPPVLTWCSVQKGGGRGLLTWQPRAQSLNVSFKLSKKVNIFI
jgi:hypothetical protein